jgi:4'-phosphopantetheinyl transferase
MAETDFLEKQAEGRPALGAMNGPQPVAIGWAVPSPLPVLGKAEVHVWAFALSPVATSLETLNAKLSPEERERAQRFRFERHRNRFIAGRGQLRMLLGHYLNREADTLRFDSSERGKPFLNTTSHTERVEFNLAHSDDLGLLAVTKAGPIGVDVERIRPMRDADELVARFFSERENERFQKLPEPDKESAFFNLWTRKEAWLKATGEGISRLLKEVEVSFVPGEPARFLKVPAQDYGITWHVYELQPGPGFTGALAAPEPGLSIKQFQFAPFSKGDWL